VKLEDVPFGLDVGHGEFNFAVDTTGADQSGVETFDLDGQLS
jgi:hypothetical protein